MLIKIIIILLIVFMVYNLFKALSVMNKNDGKQRPMSTYIGRRVFTSAAIILFIIVLLLTGIITPNPRPY